MLLLEEGRKKEKTDRQKERKKKGRKEGSFSFCSEVNPKFSQVLRKESSVWLTCSL